MKSKHIQVVIKSINEDIVKVEASLDTKMWKYQNSKVIRDVLNYDRWYRKELFDHCLSRVNIKTY